MASNFDLLPEQLKQELAGVTEVFLMKKRIVEDSANMTPTEQNIAVIELKAASLDVTRVSQKCVDALGELG